MTSCNYKKKVLIKLPEYVKRQTEKIIQSLNQEDARALDGAASHQTGS